MSYDQALRNSKNRTDPVQIRIGVLSGICDADCMLAIVSNRTNMITALSLWAMLLALVLGVSAFFERQRLVGDLTAQTAILHRLASQRADQHDAHLTSLSAIFVVGGAERQDLFLEVASTITRFYPRIKSAHVVPFDPEELGINSAPGPEDADAVLIRRLAQGSAGLVQIAQSEARSDHYWVIKRTPNTDRAEHALALLINAADLIATDNAFWQMPSVTRRLVTPEGQVLAGQLGDTDTTLAKPLGSRSQPLVLETQLVISLSDVLPLGQIAWIAALVSIAFVIAVAALRQRSRRQKAEQSAELSAQETRLAHASRVNAMGEMASGMAHELAQPLTAILSQAQAGRRLVRRGDVTRLEGVLDDTVTQAQRAADILDRLRRWSKPNRADLKLCTLHEAVNNVVRLLAREAESGGARITRDFSDVPLTIKAEPVELEQVIFNLIRNALEASEKAQIKVSTRLQDGQAILDVSDSGPGIPKALMPRIFEPFATGKSNGTGLGLALCQRLAEEMDGDIALLPDTDQTTFRISFPLVTEGVPA